MREIYTQRLVCIPPDFGNLKEHIKQGLKIVESRARTRLLPEDFVNQALRDVTENRYGHIEADGGRVNKSYRYPGYSTLLEIWWCTWRRKRHIFLEISRKPLQPVPFGREASIRLAKEKCRVYGKLFPSRVAKYNYHREIHKWRKYFPGLKPSEKIKEVYQTCDIWPETPLILFKASEGYFLVTPIGYIGVPRFAFTKFQSPKETIECALAGFGIHVKKHVPWKDIEGDIILATLGGDSL